MIGVLSQRVKRGRELQGSLSSKHVVVTGRGEDIGRAMAEMLDNRAAKVAPSDLRPFADQSISRGDRLAKVIQLGQVGFRQVNVCNWAAVRSALKEIDPFDVVIGNAGIFDSAPFLEVTDDQ